MTILGSKLTALGAASGTIGTTDLIYLVRGGTQYKATLSQLRIGSAQISDATALGLALLTAANPAAAGVSLGLGDLAYDDTVGTSEIDNAAVTLDKLVNLTDQSILLGDVSNRPAELPVSDLGLFLLQDAPSAPIPDTDNDPDNLRDTVNAILDALRIGTGHGFLLVGS